MEESAWLFDRVLSVDATSGRLATSPSRGPAMLIALGVAAIPAALIWVGSSGPWELTEAGAGVLLAFAFVALALLVVPWLPSNRRVVLDLAERTVRVGRSAPLPFENILHRRFADARGRARAEISVSVAAGQPLRLLYLANDGVAFAADLTDAVAARLRGDETPLRALAPAIRKLHWQSVGSAAGIAAVGVGLGGFFLRFYGMR